MPSLTTICCSPGQSGYYVLDDRKSDYILRDLVDIPYFINRKVGPVICAIAGAIFAGSFFYYGFPVFSKPKEHPVRFSIIVAALAMIVICTVIFVAYGIWNHFKNRPKADIQQIEEVL